MAVTVHDIPPRDPDDRSWIRRGVWSLVILLLVGGGVFAAYEMGMYGNHRSEEKLRKSTAQVAIEFVKPPASSAFTPSMDIIESLANPDSLMNDVIAFAGKPAPAPAGGEPFLNYNRLQNPQDSAVLRDLAAYLQGDTDKGKGAELALHNRAWIKSIRSIKRESNRQTNTEQIWIDAEFREPLGFVAQGDAYYLVERVTTVGGQKQAVRLPGTYSLAARRALAELPCVTGIDAPAPEPGRAFTSPDAIAGLELAAVLAQQPYARQIAMINMSNYQGRQDPDPRKLRPFITLETIFANTSAPGEPSVLWWGRPVGEEEFYEVRSPAKLQYLTRLFMKYNRIDAAVPWVDLRFDQPIIPMAKTPPRSDSGPGDTASIASAAH